MKPRILHITKHYVPINGGLERYINSLITHSSDFADHTILCLNINDQFEKNRLPSNDIINGVSIIRIRLPLVIILFDLIKIRAFLGRFDFIHFHTVGFLFDVVLILGLGVIKNQPLLSTHGLLFHHPRLKFFKKVYLLRLNFFYTQDLKLLCSGSQDLEILQKLRIRQLIPFFNPIDSGHDFSAPQKGKTGIIFISRIQKSKRIEFALSIFDQMLKNGFKDTISLHLSGSKKDIRLIQDNQLFQSSFPNLIFNFNSSDSEKFYDLNKSKVLINPSLYEGFGYTIIEGLIGDCHVLTSESVFQNFIHLKTSNLYEINDHASINDWIKKINQLLSQPITTDNFLKNNQNETWANKAVTYQRILHEE